MDPDPTDEQLLAAFVKGDREALGALAARYETLLLGLARGLLGGSSSLAHDAVQETWMRVIRYGGSFNGRSSFKTWLYRIAINRCRDLIPRSRPGRLESEPGETMHAGPDGHGGATSLARERVATLRGAIVDLPTPKREVILLCYHEGMTHELAARVLEIPIGTLKSRLHAALEELRRRLPDEVRDD